ncbi:MAG: helix-turn-helix transcriptional regulator [Oscillospiraceae bacterium]|nr:helix-turn-helix transcriptional regulator [Oscillospiraceae bacterium]
MTTGEKLAMYRKQNNYTQEQLAELLGVSRQAVSKWESGTAYPETEKLIRLSEMYGCSLDYLLKDVQPEAKELSSEKPQTALRLSFNDLYIERKSSRMVHGVPLWHVNIGLGRTAKGIFALGFAARGVFSCGLFSMGVFSCGVLSLGAVAMGSFALGLVALGAVALGLIALGAVAVGAFAMGGAAVGLVSVGGAAAGHYLAYGDSASAQVAIGITQTNGEHPYITGMLDKAQRAELISYIDTIVPPWLQWATGIVRALI